MMNPQLLYLTDLHGLDFSATVVQALILEDGRPAVVLDRSYFYPASGGQECDTGQIGAAQVVEVIKQGDPPVTVHVLDREIPPGPVQAHIDPQRRLRNSQIHTAQHLLSACFLRMFQLNTISVHLKGEAVSNLDLDGYTLSTADIKQVEDFANQVIWENRPVRFSFVAPDELEKLSVRGGATVEKDIRLVEIEGLDLTPCGGTHVSQTGALGSIKILKHERQGQGTRVWFVAGEAALRTFQSYQDVLVELGKLMNASIQDLPAVAGRQAELLKAAQQDLQTLKRERLVREAEDLAAKAQAHEKFRYIQAIYQDRLVEDLRFLGEQLSRMPAITAALATSGNGRYSLVVACAVDTGLSAAALLSTALSHIGGRGGGSQQLAQGGGVGGQEQVQAVIETIQLAILGRE